MDTIKDLVAKMRLLRMAFDNSQVPLEKREDIQTKFAAALLAGRLPIPSSAIEGSPKIHYVETAAADVNEMIGTINEQIVINIDAVQAEVYNHWKNRYELTHFPMIYAVSAMKAEFADCEHDINFIYQVLGAR